MEREGNTVYMTEEEAKAEDAKVIRQKLRGGEKLTADEERKLLFAPVTNYSRAKRLAQALIGPTARVTNYEGKPVQIIMDGEAYGEGATFADAFLSACYDMDPGEITRLAGPVLYSIHTATARVAGPRR